ncbi:hypothetical protein U9M48_031881 [Paspalum notatum var. saurae]|uniref:Integrase catalytic domain-containing protein n=1 Tax=Paspalum notatum var. saurae TaxID=547442 RepID=A0AAQ3X4V8_PASNO
MRALRSDNGSKFKNDRFKTFCHSEGLEHQFSSPYVPQQNGVVERKNWTLVEMARMMLDEHRTPRKFWAEAINTACYVSNRIFLRAALNKTSYELRLRRQPKVSHLRVFSCRCFMLKQGNLDKFEPCSSDGVFLGYATHSRAYRVWLLDFGRIVETCEPHDVGHALSDANWVNAMHEELENFERNQVWILVEPPPHCNPIGTKWVFKNKQGEDGVVVINKARLVAQDGCEECHPKWVYRGRGLCRQPPGFEHPKFPNRMFKLQKALYGLKQAPRAWYERLRKFLVDQGFQMGSVDKTLFLLKHGKDLLIVQIYVDDIIFGGSSHALGSKFSEQMSSEFKMSMMGELQLFLGLQIRQTPQGTFVHQSKYTTDLLWKFEMADASPQMTPMGTSTALDADEDGKEVDQKVYRGMIGPLLNLTATRPDIHFAVGLCACFQASPRESHRTAVKRILRYIKFTLEFGLWYSVDSSLSLLGFSNSDLAGCRIDRKSTSGTCQFWGTSLVSWNSRKQSSVATSTCEAEYAAAASCCSQILRMLATLRDYGLTYGRIPILCGSSSAISVAKNPVLHSRNKHIDVRYHFLRENYEKGMIDIVKVASENQVADILTKPLDLETFARLRGELGGW